MVFAANTQSCRIFLWKKFQKLDLKDTTSLWLERHYLKDTICKITLKTNELSIPDIRAWTRIIIHNFTKDLRNEIKTLKNTENNENSKKSEKELRKKQHRKIANHGITTQKLNENAKKWEKVIFSHKSRKYFFVFFFGPRSFQLQYFAAILWPPLVYFIDIANSIIIFRWIISHSYFIYFKRFYLTVHYNIFLSLL